MAKRITMPLAIFCSCSLMTSQALAQWSSTVTLVSDYLFNGVSQTSEDPALQASIDWAGDAGVYAGTWASYIDFGGTDETDLEWDFYLGYYTNLTENLDLDIGIAQYTYRGAPVSDDYDYAEAYVKFNFSTGTYVNVWYAWDYFGTDAGHYIIMLGQTLELAENWSLDIAVDRSVSTDEDKWEWGNSSAYTHAKLHVLTSYHGWNFAAGVETTSLDDDDGFNADTTLVFSVSRTFELR